MDNVHHITYSMVRDIPPGVKRMVVTRVLVKSETHSYFEIIKTATFAYGEMSDLDLLRTNIEEGVLRAVRAKPM